jgi:hypothetical protein
VPPNARSVVLNVTATDRGGATAITLIATPAADSIFTGWTGACTGTARCNLNVTGTIDIFSFATSHVVVDVVGYFA